MRECHLGDFKHRADLCSWHTCAHFIHQDCIPGQVLLICSEMPNRLATCEVLSIEACKCWHLGDDIETRCITLAAARVERHPDGSPQFPSVNSEDIDTTLARCDQEVVATWMQIEPCSFALTDHILAEERPGDL